MLAPKGAPASSVKVNALAGTSASVAVTVKVKRFPSTTLRFPIGVNTGGALTSLTTMLIVSAALIFGEPLSVTVNVTEFVLGPCASVGVHVKVDRKSVV